MSRLIFINLAIDQLWDPTGLLRNLFPLRVPSSERIIRSNEDLGIFLAKPEDRVLLFSKKSETHNAYLQQYFTLPKTISLRENPFDVEKWIHEVQTKLSSETLTGCKFVSAGLSSLEEKLIARLQLTSTDCGFNSTIYQKYNCKTFLVEWTKSNQIPFPNALITSDLTNIDFDAFASNWILKSDFGSGGGGNLDSTIITPRFIQHLNRLTQEEQKKTTSAVQQKKWILQQKYQRRADYSAFGFIYSSENTTGYSISPIQVAKIGYDQKGLSATHELISFAPELQPVEDVYLKIAEELAHDGYRGPFGFDSILTETHGLFPLIDLNVRMTKTHLIAAAADKLQMKNWRAIRIRWPQSKAIPFEEWLSKISQALNLNTVGENPSGAIMRPYLVGSMTETLSSEDLGGPREISVFCAVSNNSPAKLNEWCQTVESAILGVAHAYTC